MSPGELQTDLDGRVAIVTGAAQGIGESIATFLAKAGAAVLLADIQEDRVGEVARRLRAGGHRAVSYCVDVRDSRSASAMVASCLEEFGTVDVLINNAGIDAPPGAAWEIDEEHWHRLIDTNLTGAWWCTTAVLGPMKRQRSGRIVFISSGSARIGDPGISVAYNASKAGLIGLTIGLSVHLEPFGILVNAIAPGYTGTGEPMTSGGALRLRRRAPAGDRGTRTGRPSLPLPRVRGRRLDHGRRPERERRLVAGVVNACR